MRYFAENAKEILFPSASLPQQRVPPSTPLPQLLGTYKDPSYGAITLKNCVGHDAISGVFPGRLPLDPFILEHISGDNFLATADLVKLIPIRAQATFKKDTATGQLKLGINFAEEITTWFQREVN